MFSTPLRRSLHARLACEVLEGRRLLAADIVLAGPVYYDTTENAYEVGAGDLNGDDIVDLVVVDWYSHRPNRSDKVAVFLGRGDGTFEPKFIDGKGSSCRALGASSPLGGWDGISR